MTLYNVFETEEEAIDAQAYDYQTWLDAHPDPAYQEETTCWDIVRFNEQYQVWCYTPCPTSDAIYNTQDITFPSEEPPQQ